MKFTMLSLMVLSASLTALVTEAKGGGSKPSKLGGRSKSSKLGGKGAGKELLRNVDGALFTMTNSNTAPRGNELVMYHRFREGCDFTPNPTGRFPTGDMGQPPPPISSFPIISVNKYIFVANLGDNTVSTFAVNKFGAVLAGTVDSNGHTPASLDYHNRVLYVLNGAFNAVPAGDGIPSLAAFQVSKDGTLESPPFYTREFTDYEDMGGSQVSVSPDGEFLLVCIQGGEGEGAVLIFTLDKKGVPSADPVSDITGLNFLFGFATAYIHNVLYVYIGSVTDGTISAYSINEKGMPTLVTPGVVGPPQDAALCWVVRSGNYLYGTNFAINTISSWVIDPLDGQVALLNDIAFDFESGGPTDALVLDGILYVNLPLDGRIVALEIQHDGSLTSANQIRSGEQFAQLGLAAVDF